MALISKDDFIKIHENNKTATSIDEKNYENAVKFIKSKPLPNKKNEQWTKTNINKVLEHNYVNKNISDIKEKQITNYKLEQTNANEITFINGKFSKTLTKITDDDKLLILTDMASAKEKKPKIFEKYISKSNTYKDNYFAALNTVFASNGVFIYIKKDIVVKNPIFIYNIITESGEKNISLFRNMLIAEQNSKANIVFSYRSESKKYCLTNIINEIYVEQNAHIDFNNFQAEGDNFFHFSTTKVEQLSNSNFYCQTMTTNGNIVRNDLNIDINGENCYTELNGLYLPEKQQHFDNTINIEHKLPHSLSNQFYRGIIADNASAVFYGNVHICKGAIKTEANQKNNNILLSEYAKIHSKPQLIIDNDDVAASHGSTVGQLDKDAIFYMQARGISKKRATTLLLKAFAGEVLDKIRIPKLKTYLKTLLDKKLDERK